MKDILLDIVTHTHPLGRLPDLKIETDDEGEYFTKKRQ